MGRNKKKVKARAQAQVKAKAKAKEKEKKKILPGILLHNNDEVITEKNVEKKGKISFQNVAHISSFEQPIFQLKKRKVNPCTPQKKEEIKETKDTKQNKTKKEEEEWWYIDIETILRFTPEDDIVLNNSSDSLDDLHFYALCTAEVQERHDMDGNRPIKYVTLYQRSVVVDWLIDVTDDINLNMKTLHLAIMYFDRILNTQLSIRELQLAGAACLWIASKYEEIDNRLNSTILITVSDSAFTKKELISMEARLLALLQFTLSTPTIWEFCQLLLYKLNLTSPILQSLTNVSFFSSFFFSFFFNFFWFVLFIM